MELSEQSADLLKLIEGPLSRVEGAGRRRGSDFLRRRDHPAGCGPGLAAPVAADASTAGDEAAVGVGGGDWDGPADFGAEEGGGDVATPSSSSGGRGWGKWEYPPPQPAAASRLKATDCNMECADHPAAGNARNGGLAGSDRLMAAPRRHAHGNRNS